MRNYLIYGGDFIENHSREYYTEKLKKRFFLIDEHLRTGIFDVRRIITEMEVTNIFSLGQSSSLLLNKFKDAHATNLTIVDQKIESFRQRIKTMISNSCNSSYIAFKEEKKITLDDNVTTDGNNNNNNKKVKKIKIMKVLIYKILLKMLFHMHKMQQGKLIIKNY